MGARMAALWRNRGMMATIGGRAALGGCSQRGRAIFGVLIQRTDSLICREGSVKSICGTLANAQINQAFTRRGGDCPLRTEIPMAAMKQFTVHAEFDVQAGVWLASNDQLPLRTEAPTFDQLLSRVMEIAPEIAEMNGLAARGDQLKIHFTTDRIAAVVG